MPPGSRPGTRGATLQPPPAPCAESVPGALTVMVLDAVLPRLSVAVTVMVCVPVMLVRSHSNGAVVEEARRICGDTATSTWVMTQSSRVVTLTVKLLATALLSAGDVIRTVGGGESLWQPKADGLAP